MNTITRSPGLLDDEPEKEKGPKRSDNNETGQSSDEAHAENSEYVNGSQAGELDAGIISFASATEASATAPEVDGDNDAFTPETLTPNSILALRLPASALEGVETKHVRPKITVGKPPKDQFFMVKKGPDNWIPFGLLESERTSSFYLVMPGAVRDWMLEHGIKSYFDGILCLAVTRHGEPRVWPLKQTDNLWHVTAREIAEMAKKDWVKLISDQTAGYYVAGKASDQSKQPAWPEESFEEILEKAFAGRIIDTLDHEVIKELRGDD